VQYDAFCRFVGNFREILTSDRTVHHQGDESGWVAGQTSILWRDVAVHILLLQVESFVGVVKFIR
jgi:hypothetical protein